MSDIYNFMKVLNRKAAEELIKVYNTEKNLLNFLSVKTVEELMKAYNNASIPIIFPPYQYKYEDINGHINIGIIKKKVNIRVSEQELRFAMVYLFDKVKPRGENYYFSVETPTVEKYSFSGSNVLSARSDMTIYDGIHQINIELKGINPDMDDLEKDIEKLLREKADVGAWCYILENANDKTCKSLLGKSNELDESDKSGKIEKAFKNVFKKISGRNEFVRPKPIYFSFLVLNGKDKGTFYSKELNNCYEYCDFFGIESEQDLVKKEWKKWQFNETTQKLE